jgi:uncharacterized membrane protein
MTTTTSSRPGFAESLRQSPAVEELRKAAEQYAAAQVGRVADKAGERLGKLTGNLENIAETGKLGFVGETGKRIAGGDSPLKAGLMSAATQLKDKVGGQLGQKVKSLFGRGRGGGGQPKMANIVEAIDIGAPVQTVYDQWTQFQEFPKFAKGVESVEQQDETTTTWRVKVGPSRRSWKGKVIEQEPDRRIVWSSEGSKGSTKGVVTFHPLADDLTRVLLNVEYYPQGLFEKTGNIWRVGGRRVRLDLKHFRRFIMMQNEATGSWRGRIEDGEVVERPEDVERKEAAEEEPQEEPQAEAEEEEEVPQAEGAEPEEEAEEPAAEAEEPEEEEAEEPEEPEAEAEGYEGEEEYEEPEAGAEEPEAEEEPEEPEAEAEEPEEEEREEPRRPSRQRERRAPAGRR